MLQSSFIFLLTDNSKKTRTYSFRTNVKIEFSENFILNHCKTIYYKINLNCDYFSNSLADLVDCTDN